jgi:hypothetical protein
MKKKRTHRLARAMAAGGTVTLATLGLTTCSDDDGCGGGVVDPLPPPLTCTDADHGQNLQSGGSVQEDSLTVWLFDAEHSHAALDTLTVTDVLGAVLDSVYTRPGYIQLRFTLDSLTTTEVKFTLVGTWGLQAGPCPFQRTFTVTVGGGSVTVAQRERRFPLEPSRDVRIELVDRDGLRVNLRAALSGEGVPEWRVTAGSLERTGRLGVTWQLPAEPGFYQVELSVDRGVHGVGFDALALEVG